MSDRYDEPSSTAVVEKNETSQTIQGFRLVVRSGPDQGASFQSSGARTVVGSHDTADFVLNDRTVSRFHCELVIDDAGVLIRDLDSRNGTRIGPVAVQSARLERPAVLTVGQTDLELERITDEIEIPLAPQDQFGDLVGSSPAMRAVFALLERAAGTRANILIEGEPGTGKQLAAQAVHEASRRCHGALGVVDCVQPEATVRRELFGSDADDEPGAFELCDGGTLVLDELGALPPALQGELVRALDERAVRRPDGGLKRDVDVRIVATSRRNLRRDVNAGRFKTSLYSLVAVLRVRMPPLRERMLDIPVLVASFLEQLEASDSPAGTALRSGSSIESLRNHTWPDNVRELRSYVERCVALERVVAPDGAAAAGGPPIIDTGVPLKAAREEWVRYFERCYLGALLEETGQNVSAAARKAGVDRVHMHRLLKNVGLR